MNVAECVAPVLIVLNVFAYMQMKDALLAVPSSFLRLFFSAVDLVLTEFGKMVIWTQRLSSSKIPKTSLHFRSYVLEKIQLAKCVVYSW